MAQLNLRTLSDDEKERLYYQAGLPELALIYAQSADVQAENDEYQAVNERMVEAADYDKQVALVEHLQDHIRDADAKLSELHDYISDELKLNKTAKAALLEMLTAVKLDPDTEPAPEPK